MNYQKLSEDIKKMLPHKIPYGTLVGAPWPYTGQGDMVYEEPEHYLMEQAATAIAELLSRAEDAESAQDTFQRAMAEYKARAEKAERERGAAVKELEGVAAAVDDLDEFIDNYVHPFAPYDVYSALRDNVDAIAVWKYESEWRGKQKEE